MNLSLIPNIKNIASDNFFLIAGPCAIEGEDMALNIAKDITEITDRLEIPYIFKGSLHWCYENDASRTPWIYLNILTLKFLTSHILYWFRNRDRVKSGSFRVSRNQDTNCSRKVCCRFMAVLMGTQYLSGNCICTATATSTCLDLRDHLRQSRSTERALLSLAAPAGSASATHRLPLFRLLRTATGWPRRGGREAAAHGSWPSRSRWPHSGRARPSSSRTWALMTPGASAAAAAAPWSPTRRTCGGGGHGPDQRAETSEARAARDAGGRAAVAPPRALVRGFT